MRQLFVVSEVREVESSGGRDRNLNVMLNLATAVKEEWLRELFPRDFHEERTVTYDPALRRVVARVERRFRDLILEESLTDNPPLDEAAAILAREVSARVAACWRTGMMRSSSGFCALTACVNGWRNWHCRQSEPRIAPPSLSIFAMGRSAMRRSRIVPCCQW